MENLQLIANQWRAVGLQLGLSSIELDRIETTPILILGGPAAFLKEVLSKWLQRAPPPPTLTKLCVALNSHEVRQSRIAQELKQQYKTKRAGLSAHEPQALIICCLNPLVASVSKFGDALKICNGIIFDFSPGLPHMPIYIYVYIYSTELSLRVGVYALCKCMNI